MLPDVCRLPHALEAGLPRRLGEVQGSGLVTTRQPEDPLPVEVALELLDRPPQVRVVVDAGSLPPIVG
jgi:hypothetical protein